MEFLVFATFWLKFLPELNIKAMHNLQKVQASSSHHGLCLCQFSHFYYFWFLG